MERQQYRVTHERRERGKSIVERVMTKRCSKGIPFGRCKSKIQLPAESETYNHGRRHPFAQYGTDDLFVGELRAERYDGQ